MQLTSKSFALRAAAVATTLAFSQIASAGFVAATTGDATVQGSAVAPPASGPVNAVVLPAISGATSNATITSGAATVTFQGDAAEAKTPNTFYYAAPLTSGGQTSPFLTTNTTMGGPNVGTYTLTFSTAQSYLGLLWGSIGAGDLITFYNGSTVVGTVNGTTAQAAATAFNPTNGSQQVGGSQYELINFLNGAKFTSAVFSENVQASFESAGFTYAATNVGAVPEPGSVLLLGIGVAGLVASRRRKTVAA